MTVDVHLPNGVNEQTCANCTQPATSVIASVPQCDEHAGERIRDGYPEIFGAWLAKTLREGQPS